MDAKKLEKYFNELQYQECKHIEELIKIHMSIIQKLEARRDVIIHKDYIKKQVIKILND
jgi:hypothetical protein